jgi:hypothetical protein
MTFTPSAINATRRLSTEASMNIAKLKSGNAYEYANLSKEMSKIEIAHQLSVNKIISDANEKILNKRETTRKALTDVQSNILLTEKEKIERIAKLKNDYAKFRADTESSTLKATRDSNKDIESRLNDIIIKLDKDKLDAKQELTSLIKNGQWDNLSDINKNKLAKRSGLTLGEIEGEKTSAIYASVNTSLQAILGKDFIVTPKSSKIIYDSALAYVAMGDSVQVAIQKAINANIKNLDEYTESQKYQADTRALDLAKSQAAINSTNESIRASQSATRMAENKAKQEAKNPWVSTGGVNEDGFVLMYNKDNWSIEYRKPELVKSPEEWKSTKGTELLDAPDGTVIPSRLKEENKATNWGKQCGEFANDVTWRIPVWELAEQRKSAFTDKVPVVGAQVFFSWEWYDKKYGHVSVVTKVNKDASGNVVSFDVRESNLKNDWAVGSRTNIPVSKANWFYNSTDLAKRAWEKLVTDDLDEMRLTGKPSDVAANLLQSYGVTDVTPIERTAYENTAAAMKKQDFSPAESKIAFGLELFKQWKVSPSMLDTGFIKKVYSTQDEILDAIKLYSWATKVDRNQILTELKLMKGIFTEDEKDVEKPIIVDDKRKWVPSQFFIEQVDEKDINKGFVIKQITEIDEPWFGEVESADVKSNTILTIPPRLK